MTNEAALVPTGICGAHARSSGEPCKQKAGANTQHSGEGRCWLHGGNAGRTPVGHRSGRRSLVPVVLLTDRLEELLGSDELLSVDREAEYLQTAVEDALAQLDSQRPEEVRAWDLLAEAAAERGDTLPILKLTAVGKDEQDKIELLVQIKKNA